MPGLWRAILAALVLQTPAVRSADPDASEFPPSFGPIAGADLSVREKREVQVPAGIRAFRTADALAVCADSGPLKPITPEVGKKMVLGMRRKFYLYREGTARPARPSYEELGGPLTKTSNLPQFYQAEPFGALRRGQPYVVEFEITIFETDIPGQHMWSPESGKYKVLWQTTLQATPQEQPTFPEDIQKAKADRERFKAEPGPPPDIPADFLRTDSPEWQRILATPITAGFQSAPVDYVVRYLNGQTPAKITLRLKDQALEKHRGIFRGFDKAPLRDALYWIKNDTQYRVEWELKDEVAVGIVITDE